MKPHFQKTALEHYEKLREEGLTSGWNHCRGWGVFVRSGMLAWSTARELFEKNEIVPSTPIKITPIPEHLSQPLIQVLTGIVVSIQQEVYDDV